MLLRSISDSFTKEDLKQHGNQSIKKAFSKIEAEKGLRKVFDSCDAAGGFTVDQRRHQKTVFSGSSYEKLSMRE